MPGTFSSWIRERSLPELPRNRDLFRRTCRSRTARNVLGLVSGLALVIATPALATIDDAIASAVQTTEQYENQGYTAHEEDEWGGDLGVDESKVIQHDFVHGNDYWFCLGTDVESARVTIHVYNDRGTLVETTAWQAGSHAGAQLLNPPTASYYIVVKIIASPAIRTHWAMVYGSRASGGQKAM
jgi:hypothetical protein